jgi:alkylation response protein AidB-like acyl-CoA dehydrogenase
MEHIPDSPRISFWEASPLFRALILRKLDDGAWSWAEPQLAAMGDRAAFEVAPQAAVADRESPRLITHDARGVRIDRVDYHPAYRAMERVAYGSGMIAMKYTDHPHRKDAHVVGYALGYLFAMAEMGLYCPLCMTDGVARVLSRHGSQEMKSRIIPHLAATEPEMLWTGGMFVTERAGGSDVGANETVARRAADGTWRLSGRKWFCSNVDAQAVLVTARPEGAPEGTRGLRTFLLLPRGNQGVTIDRLKEKLGVRSMPTGEVSLHDAPAEEIGSFAPMAEMMNLSRLYNAVASVAVIGRAIHEARSYIEQRNAFGRPVIEFPLVQETLADLEAEHAGAMLLTFEAVDALRRADQGDAEAARLLRILTPVAKAVTGKLAVPCVSEAMELIGGNGYIEESPLPRLLRDAQVLPIWEGTTNILVLDTLRTTLKERGHEMLLARVEAHDRAEAEAIATALESLDERDARGWVDRLARAYQRALLVEGGESEHAERLKGRPLGLIPGARA